MRGSLQAHLLLRAASSLNEEEAVAVIKACALRVGEAACVPLIDVFFVRRLCAKVQAFLERVPAAREFEKELLTCSFGHRFLVDDVWYTIGTHPKNVYKHSHLVITIQSDLEQQFALVCFDLDCTRNQISIFESQRLCDMIMCLMHNGYFGIVDKESEGLD
jgi:hypothetical protein